MAAGVSVRPSPIFQPRVLVSNLLKIDLLLIRAILTLISATIFWILSTTENRELF